MILEKNHAALETALQGYPAEWSNSPTPVVIIAGDGGAARYVCYVDGVLIGNFPTSNPYGQVRVQLPEHPDGLVTFTFNELSPNAGSPTWPLQFTIDTQPPAAPIVRSVTVGPANTSSRYPLYIHGSSTSTERIFVRSLPNAVSGGTVSAAGAWNLSTIPVTPATYQILATAYDKAGNPSPQSAPFTVTVGTVPKPTVPGAPTASAKISVITLTWEPSTLNSGTPTTGYVIKRNGTQVAMASADARSYVDTAPIRGASYVVTAINSVGATDSPPVTPWP